MMGRSQSLSWILRFAVGFSVCGCFSLRVVIDPNAPDFDAGFVAPGPDAQTAFDTPDARMIAPILGQRCNGDDECGSLRCDRTVIAGECTVACDLTSPDEGASICTRYNGVCVPGNNGDPRVGHCAPRCAQNSTAQCRLGYLCYANTVAGFMTTALACRHFCVSDEGCLPTERCNTRTGYCGAAQSDPSRRRDGELCATEAPQNECRGECVAAIGAPVGVGVCQSRIDIVRTELCPDDGLAPLVVSGTLGVCSVKRCDAARCCGDVRRCFTAAIDADAGVCQFETTATGVRISCGDGETLSDAGTLPDASAIPDATGQDAIYDATERPSD